MTCDHAWLLLVKPSLVTYRYRQGCRRSQGRSGRQAAAGAGEVNRGDENMKARDRAAARERCQATTPDERAWEARQRGVSLSDCARIMGVTPERARLKFDKWTEAGAPVNSIFYVHARADLVAALDALDAADRRITELEQGAADASGGDSERTTSAGGS
jgi:hypothetical protein